MFYASINDSLSDWRVIARRLLVRGISPADVVWGQADQGDLFASDKIECESGVINIPAEFFRLAERVACFDDPRRWSLLYRIAYRLVYETRSLLLIASDPDVRDAHLMEKAVRRDIHKFHAFVRFRRVDCDDSEVYVAWHEPQHMTVELAAPFFARRFGSMRFSILTPRGSAHWDASKLRFGPPADRSMAPRGDDSEDFWLLYYRSIFNPFRLNIKVMKREMPMRHWRTLPEAALIPELTRQASGHTVPLTAEKSDQG